MPKNQVSIQEARSSWSGPQEIHYRVTSFTRQWTARPHLWRPPTDLYETEHGFVARIEIAGMQDAELNIAIEGSQLAIYGLRQPPSDHGAYHQLEVRYGDFLSVMELPGRVDADRIEAKYNDGFLLVTLPKAGSR
ncbi:MAG: Hsp20/alpha crystallin family protein [Anaerolineales bacterium]